MSIEKDITKPASGLKNPYVTPSEIPYYRNYAITCLKLREIETMKFPEDVKKYIDRYFIGSEMNYKRLNYALLSLINLLKDEKNFPFLRKLITAFRAEVPKTNIINIDENKPFILCSISRLICFDAIQESLLLADLFSTITDRDPENIIKMQKIDLEFSNHPNTREYMLYKRNAYKGLMTWDEKKYFEVLNEGLRYIKSDEFRSPVLQEVAEVIPIFTEYVKENKIPLFKTTKPKKNFAKKRTNNFQYNGNNQASSQPQNTGSKVIVKNTTENSKPKRLRIFRTNKS